MNANNKIEGLLTQKPDSPVPQVGQKRRFSVIEKTGKSGKPYNKIKSEGEGYGQLYEIVSVQKTDFIDSHQNVSFSVSLSPAANGNGASSASRSNNANGNGADRQNRIERQHSQEMALRYLAIKGEIPQSFGDYSKLVSLFQRDIGQSPAKVVPQPEPVPEPEPQPGDSGEPSQDNGFDL